MLTDHVVLITGGATGIGCAIADAFLQEGARVHICDVDAAAMTAFTGARSDATGTVADASTLADVERVFDDLVSKHGRLDILVNNVGIAGPTALVEEITPADWERTIAVDLNAHFFFTRRAIPLLKERGGSIINIASNAAFSGLPLRAPYTVCKWAMIGFTKTLAMELGPHKVRVNALCPGSVKGPRIDAVIKRDADHRGMTETEIRDVYQRQSSLRTFVSADEVADLCVFLASAKGRNISGQAIGIDGHTESLSNWLD